MTANQNAAQNWGLTAADDSFHPINKDEPLWTETMWFAFMVPERNLLGYIYPVFRPNLRIQFGGIAITDDTAEVTWEMPIYHWQQHVPMQEGVDLRDLNLPSGLRIKSLSPGRRFHIGYESNELTLDLTYEALMQPLLSGGESDLFSKGGHLDQPGRVTGEMVLHGEKVAVDHFAMRDRAWGPRRDNRQMRVGYAYGIASDTSAFLAISYVDRGGTDKIWSGFLMRDGLWSKLASGTRNIERNARGRSVTVSIDGRDELGRSVQAKGTVKNWMANTPYPSMLCWNCLTRWTFDGQICWGEDQDVWSPRRWRQYIATLPKAT